MLEVTLINKKKSLKTREVKFINIFSYRKKS